MQNVSVPEPGFYPDPLGLHPERVFNGNRWTYTVRTTADQVRTLYDADLDDSRLAELPAPEPAQLIRDLHYAPSAQEPSDTRNSSTDTATPDSKEDPSWLRSAFATPRQMKARETGRHMREHESRLGVSRDAARRLAGDVSGMSGEELREEMFVPSSIADYRSRGIVDPRDEGWIVGQSGMVRLNNGLVEIKRTSLAMDLVAGNLRGDKAIPLRTIQAIQFKPASATVGGMIEFVVAGDKSNNGRQRLIGGGIVNTVISRRMVRMGDENVITFNRTQEPPFKELHQTLLRELASIGVSPERGTADIQPLSRAEEIRELKALLDEGLLTQQEFDAAKRSILDI